MKSKRGTQPTPVGEIVKKLVKNLSLEGRLTRERIYQLWPLVVGESLAQHSWPASFRGKTLVVGVADSLWMQKLSLNRQAILEGIARELGPGLFEELRFVLGPRPPELNK